MNRLEHILTCVAEESNEVGQRACKAGRFGLDEVQPGHSADNWERMIHEFHDLFGVLMMLSHEVERPWQDLIPAPHIIDAKVKRVEKYMAYAAEQGALQ